ncbi:MAG: hypothetical protein KGJ48_13185, partial [Nitrospirota bacterium]|nr:hypothetical protein [Nitrospirota bacterium]
LLGNGVTLTITAARVEQLYDFEAAILVAGIPANAIRQIVSVIHKTPVKQGKAVRPSDENVDAPVLLVAHNKIRGVYRRDESWKARQTDLVYFLKCKGEPRDLVIWDERCRISESVAIKVKKLHQALAALKALPEYAQSHAAFIQWLSTTLRRLQKEVGRLQQAHGYAEAILSDLKPDNLQAFYTLVTRQSRELDTGLRNHLTEFLEIVRFKVRVLPDGVVSYRVVIPDCMENVLVLDASFGLSELTQLDTTIQNLEAAHPLLLELHRQHRKHLADLKDCSDLHFLHWNKGAGKEVVWADCEAYLTDKAEGGNVILEVIEQVKQWTAEGRAVLLWTHKRGTNGKDLGEILRQCLVKAGLDGKRFQVVNPYQGKSGPISKEQIVVETYGRHDASNQYSYCSAVVHVGVQQREDLDLSGAICGQKRDLQTGIDPAKVRSIRCAERAVEFQQSNGRGQSRITRNGRALPQVTLGIWKDYQGENLTELLKPWYRGATWERYQPRFTEASEDISSTLVQKVAAHMTTLPEDVVCVGSKTVKRCLRAEGIARRTWSRIVRQFIDQQNTWKLEGQMLVKQTAEAFGF